MANNTLPITQKIYLSVEEITELTQVPKATVRALCKIPDCPFLLYPLKCGRKTLIERQGFLTYIKNNPDVLDKLA